MEIVDRMPSGAHDSGIKWDEIATTLKEGKALKFNPGTDYEVGKEQSFRSTLYLRMGQRQLKVKTTIRPDGIYIAAV